MALVLLVFADYRRGCRLILDLDLARLAAETASHHKSRFLANMSHEIRTPMNAIMGMTELALEKAADPDQRECLETVQKSAHSLLALLNDILDFSKVEAGKLDLVAVDFEVEQSVRDVLRTLDLRAREKGLELRLDVAPGVPRFVAGDDQRLQQVVLNLVGNAIKFTASGEIRVEDRLESGDTRPTTLEFVVADTGVGVRPEKQNAIFAPFEQEDDSTARPDGAGRQEWLRGARNPGARARRRDSHGYPNAGDGWLPGHRRDSREGEDQRRSPADRGAHRQCHAGRWRALSGPGYGRG